MKELEEKAVALGANAVVGVEINYATVSNKSYVYGDCEWHSCSGSAKVVFICLNVIFAIKIAKVRSISCVFSVFLKNVTVDMNQRYLFVNKGHFMKLMKHLFSSLFIAGAMLSTQALAEEKDI